MIMDRDVAIRMDDGIDLRADLFRPDSEYPAPVVMTMGPYGKGLDWKHSRMRPRWDSLVAEHPEILEGSTTSYMTWETVDPERWVPLGYAVIRVDSRGAGRSPGFLDPFSERETRDYYTAIEWAGTQKWSNGKVGLLGISYHAINQWRVAALQQPHLAAIIPWEGASDYYRDFVRHGGILSNAFMSHWYEGPILTMQHGLGIAGPNDEWLHEPATGPVTLEPEVLAQNRVDVLEQARRHSLDDDYYRSRSADLSRVQVPLLSCANWGGLGLHSRGNFEGFSRAASRRKWLEVHGGAHWESFYLPHSVELQRRFFDQFLKGEDTGWDRQAAVMLNVRHADGTFERRDENEWPLRRTRWTELYLDADAHNADWSPTSTAAEHSFQALSEVVTFSSPPLATNTEITGPLAANLFAASSSSDLDLFVTFRAFLPDGREVTFEGANDPRAPLSQGWLRASHRQLDPARSKSYQPFHIHRNIKPVAPGEVYELNVELWPTCVVLPQGSVLALTVGGCDFERSDQAGDGTGFLRGSGHFLHNDPVDRPQARIGGIITLHSGPGRVSLLLLPVIPNVPG